MSLSRDELIFLSKICEQTERFEDMYDNMKKVVNMSADLSVDDRNLLSIAFKNTVGSRRTAWRALSSIEQKEEAKGGKHIDLLKDYKQKIETELNKYCDEIIKIIDTKLIPSSEASLEAKVFYLKMKGDYYRYVAEYAHADQHKKTAENALQAYQQASEIASKNLSVTHPLRLGLALNFSVLHYEVLNDAPKACQLAK